MKTDIFLLALTISWISLAVISSRGLGIFFRLWELYQQAVSVWNTGKLTEKLRPYPLQAEILFCAPCFSFWATLGISFGLLGFPFFHSLGGASFSWLASKVIHKTI